MTRLILPDTNLFFECKRLEDLPWSVFGPGPIILLVTKPVLDEIDQHKKGNGRTRKRALETFSRVRAMLKAGANEEKVQAGQMEVVFRLAGDLPEDATPPKSLDLSKPDDRLIAILHARHGQGENVILLTHDTGPASTAQGLGLPFEMIPDDWLRAPETSPEMRRAAELEQKLAQYRKSEPVITLCLEGEVLAPQTIRRELVVWEPLDKTDVDIAIEALRAAHPPQSDFTTPPKTSSGVRILGRPMNANVRYEPPADDDKATYLNDTYPAWLERCRVVLATLHERETQVPQLSLAVALKNQGSRPANGLLITFDAQGDISIMRPDRPNEDDDLDKDESGLKADDAPKLQSLPAPPQAPKWRKVVERSETAATGALQSALTSLETSRLLNMPDTAWGVLARQDRLRDVLGRYDTMAHLALTSQATRIGHVSPPELNLPKPYIPPAHDPEAFYYKDWRRMGPVKRVSLTCDRFRHRGEAETFEFDVVMKDDVPFTASILCSVHADNLTQPVELRVRIEQIVNRRKPLAELAALLRAAGVSSHDYGDQAGTK